MFLEKQFYITNSYRTILGNIILEFIFYTIYMLSKNEYIVNKFNIDILLFSINVVSFNHNILTYIIYFIKRELNFIFE